MRLLGISILLVLGWAPVLEAQWPPTFSFATIDSFPAVFAPPNSSLNEPAAVSLRLDPRGLPHIAYKASYGRVRYATCPADRWQVEIAYRFVERDCSLLLDSEGRPWILFFGGLLERTGTGWTFHQHPFEYVDHLGGAMGADGTIHACFLHSWSGGRYDGTTEYVTYRNGRWNERTLESDDYAFTHPNAVVSMCMASTGVPRLCVTGAVWTASAAASSQPELRYWSQPTLGVVVTITHAVLGSLAVDAQDQSHLAFYDSQTQDLEYAVFRDRAWAITPVDTEGDVGMYASLALERNGNAHIAYYDRTAGDLRYAKWSAATSQWSVCVVDGTGDVGSWASLDVDARGAVHIAYFDATARVLKYASTSPVVAVAPWSWSKVKSAFKAPPVR